MSRRTAATRTGKSGSTMALTAELVARCHRDEPDLGLPPELTPCTDAEYEAHAALFLKRKAPGPFWLFAYGSLIWKPAFDSLGHCRATARGWHRAFTMRLTRWRGTPEQPGLMMVLEPGGSCVGVAYRLPDENHHDQMVRLLKRETASLQGMHAVRWITVETPDGPVQALAFWAGLKGPLRVEKQDHARVAAILARACGHAGSGAEYLFHTVSKLEEHGIRDRNLWRLQHLVAEEILRRDTNPAVDWGG
ncbi:MAG TPA: gamma-glutamylcyclotransferase [Dongiaceae bacterium]|nr:gamma-glutamylcyclotransferase [Dongiaceae bacterium]